MKDIIVRRAQECDLETVHQMAQVVFRHTYREILSPEQMEYMMEWMYSLPNLKGQLANGHVYYIAYSGSEPCGYLSVQREGTDETGTEVFHLQKIYILPHFQGRGLGKILIEQAVRHVKSLQSAQTARIELNVNRANPAVEFYKHMGFCIIRQGDFEIGHGFYMNDYIMGLEI